MSPQECKGVFSSLNFPLIFSNLLLLYPIGIQMRVRLFLSGQIKKQVEKDMALVQSRKFVQRTGHQRN